MEYKGIKEDERLIKPVPTARQLAYQSLELIGFIHFSINTFTGNEWGTGEEQEAIFHPTQLDARQWAKAAADGGMKGLILTCKHHDGFCLWPSRYTKHTIQYSPYKNGNGDIVKETAEACRAYGLKFGIYLSPWDRNQETYGQGSAYDDYYVNQLTELLTNYGDIFAVWLDGACGEGKNGKKQVYDWNRYYETVRRFQPQAVISISGPDIRWCGNEAGQVRKSEWSVVAADLADPAVTAELSQKEDDAGFRARPLDETQADLGSRACLKGEKRLTYYPAETDVSIRPGWFYHATEDENVRSFENLKEIYLSSVGGNTTLLLNLPPMPTGLLHETDVARLKQLGDFIRGAFQKNVALEATVQTLPAVDADGNGADVLCTDTYETVFKNPRGMQCLTVRFSWEDEKTLSYLVLKEAIVFSQRVEAFSVWYEDADGKQRKFMDGTTIGYKKIVDLKQMRTKQMEVRITDARVAPVLAFAGVYGTYFDTNEGEH